MKLITIYETNNKAEREIVFKHLNEWAAEVYKNAYVRFLDMCENEDQRTIFTDWWNGKCVTTDEYESKFSPQDNYDAGGIILTACSEGFG